MLGLISEDNAVGFYRVYQPLMALEQLGLADVLLTPTFHWGRNMGAATDFPDFKWFETKAKDFAPDIIVAQRHDALQYIALLMALRDFLKAPVVVDTDDDVQAVRPFNPGYGSYNPKSENLAYNIKLMSIADAISVSTPQLADRHERYGKRTFIVPNAIDIGERSFEPQERDGKTIRIGWLGSACHWENLQIIQQAVKDIVANYEQVEFVYTNLYGDIWSTVPSHLRERVIPACRLLKCKRDWHATCNKAYVRFDKYAKALNGFRIDIGLAPLYDNLFNRSKSNLRILEYWADRVAVIASPVRPYREAIRHGHDGLLALEKKEWYNAMEKLVLDGALRSKLKKNGYATLTKQWSLNTVAKNLVGEYRTVIREFHK